MVSWCARLTFAQRGCSATRPFWQGAEPLPYTWKLLSLIQGRIDPADEVLYSVIYEVVIVIRA